LYANVHSRAHSTSIFRDKIDHNFSTSNLTVGNCLGHSRVRKQQQQQMLGIASIPAIILRSLDRLPVLLQPGSLGQVVQSKESKDGLIIRR